MQVQLQRSVLWASLFILVLLSIVILPVAAANPPNASFSGTPTTGTLPFTVSFSDLSSNSPTGWAWFFGDETYTQAWTRVNVSAGWAARMFPGSVAMPDGSIVLMGGDNSIGGNFRDVWRSTDNGTKWTKQTATAGWSARSDFSSVSMPDGSIVLMGGNTGAPNNEVWRSTDKGATWTQVTTIGTIWSARFSHRSVVMADGSIVLMGGYNGSFYNDVWRSMDNGATWTEVNTSAGWLARAGHTCVTMPDGSIILMGGHNSGLSGDSVNDVWRSMDNGATWTNITTSGGWSKRYGHTSVVMPDGSIILMGGRNGSTYYKDVWRSTDNGETWTQLPDADWAARLGPICVAIPDGSIVLMGGYGPPLYNDVWRFTPTGSSLQNPSHTYNSAGVFQVALQAYNTGGYNSTRKAGYITVTGGTTAPVANFTANITSGTVPLTVKFNETSTYTPTTWNWSFGDTTWFNTTTATLANVSHTFSSAGTYTVNLTAGNNAGSNTSSRSNYIVVNPPKPIPAFSGTPTSGTLPLTVSFTDGSLNTTGWAWFFGDENFTAPWTRVNASAGWSARYGHTSVTMPDGSIVLMGGSDGGISYNDVWRSTDNGTTWTQQTADAGWTSRTLHSSVAMPDGSIVLTGGYPYMNDTWRSADNGATWTNVTASPGWSARYGHTSVAMPDGSIVLMGGTDFDGWMSGMSYNDVWRSTDKGTTWTLVNASAGWPARGYHSSVVLPDGSIVVMGGYDSSGMSYNDVWRSTDKGTTWTQVNESAGWSARYTSSGVAMPDGSIVVMGGGDSSGNFYNDVWRFVPPGSSAQNPSHTYTAGGVFQVALQAFNTGGYNSTRKTGYITVTAPPVASFTSNATTGNLPLTVQFNDTSTNTPTTWNWSFGDNTWFNTTSSALANTTHTFSSAAGTYTVNLTAGNSAGSNISSRTNYIVVKPPKPIPIFSANVTSGAAPLPVLFTDGSLNATGWAWFFGDETYTAPWTQQTASAGWAARQSHTSVAMPDGSIILMGGWNNVNIWNDVWRSTDTGVTWTNITGSPGWTARYGHTSVAMPDGSIVLMGGADNYIRMNDVWRSTDNGGNWSLMTASAEWSARYYHSSVALPDGSIVLMGGDDGSKKNDVWRSTDNGATWTLVNASAGWLTRYIHSSVAMPDGSIVLMGGNTGSANKNDTWRSTDNGATWTQQTASAGWMARDYHTSVAMPDGSIVLMGGYGGGVLNNDTWRSTNNGATWTLVNASAGWTARTSHTSVAMPDGSIVLMGGHTSVYYNDVWRFVPTGSSAQNPSHTYNLPGIYQVALQAFNTGGYNSTRKNGYVTVTSGSSSVPVASFTANKTSGTAPLTVLFNDTSTNTPTTWNWSFGDGTWFNTTSSALANATYKFSSAGTYTVNLTSGNSAGSNISSRSNYIVVTAPSPKPIPIFSANVTTGTAPLPVLFTDASSGSPTGWAWFFGDENFTAPWTQQTASAGWSSRYWHSSIAMADGSIILMGGWTNSGSLKNDVWRSTDNGAHWTQQTAGAGWSGRLAHSSVAMPDGSIILMGGADDPSGSTTEFNDTWRSTDNGATWTQQTASAGWAGRDSHSSVAMADGSIILMGGWTNSGGLKNDVWRSLDNGATWSQMNESAGWAARWGHSSVVMPDGIIVMMGGTDYGINYNDVWRSIDNGATWSQMNESAGWAARYDHSSVVLPDGSIVLMGGRDNSGNPMNDVWRSTDNGAMWTQLTPSAGWAARYAHTSVIMPDGSIVLMGGDDNGGDRNDTWQFVPTTSSVQNPSHTYTAAGVFQVALQAFNTGGYNSTRKTGYITVIAAPPVASFTGTPTTGTAPLTVQFNDTSTGSTAWNWSFKNVTPGNNTQVWWSTVRNATQTFGVGNFSIAVNASNSGGYNISTQVTFVNVTATAVSPVTSFNANVTYGTAPLPVSFTDLSLNTPTGWAWFFGDENFSAPWTQKTASAGWLARYDHSSVAMPDGSIVLMGGWYTNIMTTRRDVWRSTDKGATWMQQTASAGWLARYDHSSVAMTDGSIVLIGGGRSTSVNLNDTWRSTNNGATWTNITGSPGWSARQGHTSVAMPDGSIVLMGGRSSVYYNDVWQSTDKGTTWTQQTAGAGWSARANHTSVAMPDGSIVLMGGYDSSSVKNDTWRSTDNGGSWSLMTASAGWAARQSHTCVAMPDGSIVLMGGYDSGGNKNDTWRSTDNGATWTQLNASSGWTARYGHSSVALPEGSIVLMGGYSGGNKNDVWRFVPTGSSAQNPSHTYTSAGIYQVALQAFNTGGYNNMRKTGYIIVTGGGVPVANLNGTPTSGTVPLTVKFRDDSTNDPTIWNWSFGDGSIVNATVQDPIHNYTTAGTYTVSLNATNALGSNTKTLTGYITVSSSTAYYSVGQIINPGATVYIGEQGLNVTHSLNEGSPNDGNIDGIPVNTTIGWWASAAGIDSSAPTKTIDLSTRYRSIFIDPADFVGYTGTWYVINGSQTAQGAANSAIFKVVDPSLDVSVWDFTTSATVSGSSVSRSDDLGFWISTNMIDAIDSPHRIPVYNDTRDGYLDIRVKNPSGTLITSLKDKSGVGHSLLQQNVSFQPWTWGNVPSASANWSVGVMSGSGGYEYPQGAYSVWVESGLNNMRNNYKNSGVEYTGKTISLVYTVTLINPVPLTGFTGSPTSGNAPLTVIFIDSSTNDPTSWNWSFGDGSLVNATVQDAIHTYTTAGTYTVSLKANNTAGSNTSTRTNYITVSSGVVAPVANFAGTPTSGNAPLTVSFTDSSLNLPTGWAWFFGDENFTAPWTQKTEHAGWTARFAHSSVVLPDGSIIVMGGNEGSNRKNDTWRSTDKGATWTLMNASSGWAARMAHSSVAMPDGSIVLMGGNTSGILKNDVWRSTDKGATWTMVNSSPGWAPRVDHRTVVMADGSIVLMGGAISGGLFANDVWRSPDNGATWTQVITSGPMWSPREGHVTVVMPDGSIVLMGGYNSINFGNDVWGSSDNGATWSQAPSPAGWGPREDHSSVMLPDGSILVMGGLNNGSVRNDMFRSKDKGFSWGRPNLSVEWFSRTGHTSVVMPDGSIVLMGGKGDYGAKNDVWRFNPVGSTTQNPSHTYTNSGTYKVALQTYNTAGYTSKRIPEYITVSADPNAPKVSFTYNVTSGVVPLTVAFNDTSTGSPVSWDWSFGDNTSSTEQNPVHTFLKPQVNNVKLNVANSGGLTNQTMHQIVVFGVKTDTNMVMNGTTESIVNGNQVLSVNTTTLQNTGGNVTTTNTILTMTGGNSFWTKTRFFADNVAMNTTTGDYTITNTTQVVMQRRPGLYL